MDNTSAMTKKEIEKATFHRELMEIFKEIKEEVRIKYLRKREGFRMPRRYSLRNVEKRRYEDVEG